VELEPAILPERDGSAVRAPEPRKLPFNSAHPPAANMERSLVFMAPSTSTAPVCSSLSEERTGLGTRGGVTIRVSQGMTEPSATTASTLPFPTAFETPPRRISMPLSRAASSITSTTTGREPHVASRKSSGGLRLRSCTACQPPRARDSLLPRRRLRQWKDRHGLAPRTFPLHPR